MSDTMRAKLEFDRRICEALSIEPRRVVSVKVSTDATDARVRIDVQIFPDDDELRRILGLVSDLPIEVVLRVEDRATAALEVARQAIERRAEEQQAGR